MHYFSPLPFDELDTEWHSLVIGRYSIMSMAGYKQSLYGSYKQSQPVEKEANKIRSHLAKDSKGPSHSKCNFLPIHLILLLLLLLEPARSNTNTTTTPEIPYTL